jgi:hypothetical protein
MPHLHTSVGQGHHDHGARPGADIIAHEEGRGNAIRKPDPTRILAKQQTGAIGILDASCRER